MHLHRSLAPILLLALGAAGGVSADDEGLRELGARLQAHPIRECAPDVSSPPSVQQGLVDLRRGILAIVAEELAAAGPDRGTELAEQRVKERLRAAGVLVTGEADDDSETADCRELSTYGWVRDVSLTLHAGWVAAVIKLAIPCGDDGALALFALEPGGPRLLLVAQAPVWTEINQAWGRFDFAIVRGAEGKAPAVVTAAVSPWCTSNWQRLAYRVFRPSRDPWQPSLLAEGATTVYLGVDRPLLLRAERRGFRLEFRGGFNLDDDRITRERVLRFRIAGDRLTRVEPWALTPAAFVDEWSQLPWAQARSLCAAGAARRLRPWHRLLESERRVSRWIEEVKEVSRGRPRRFQVLVAAEGGPRLRFLAARDGDRYRLLSAGRADSKP